MTGVATGPHTLVVVGSALIGIGVGSAVAPALFLAGYSVPAPEIQKVLALVELLRAVAAFMTAPVILHIALTVNGGVKGGGIETGLWISLGIAVAGLLVAVYLLVLGRVVPHAPRIEPWLNGEDTAFDSPPLAAGIRGESLDPSPGAIGLHSAPAGASARGAR